MTNEELERFLAKGGKVARVETGARTMTEREVWLARRGENELIEERHVRGDVVYNGLGEIIGWI